MPTSIEQGPLKIAARIDDSQERRQLDAVSPIELFFDLVFVFAVSQLSHHLRDHLTWRGAAETAVMLVAVFGAWSYTTFEATLLKAGRVETHWMLLGVMLLGLFMNAAISRAFGTNGWAFVGPLLAIQIGRSTWTSPPLQGSCASTTS